MKSLARNKLLTFAVLLVVIQIVLAFGAPLFAPYDPMAQSVARRLRGPTELNWLGTDQLGRDVLTRILYGYRTSLIACVLAVGIALLAGGTLGLMAAYYRGWLDRIIMRIMDVLFAFPVMLLAIGIIAVLGPHTYSAAAAIAVVYTPIFARLLRGPALVLCESEFVAGAKAIGASDARIIFLHILPNLASVILVQTSLLLSAAILVEASLSFLGLGTQPPTPSLGLMLSEGRNFLMLSPWSAIFAGFAILFLSFGFNLLGDALRDTLDPRLRGAVVIVRPAEPDDIPALAGIAQSSYALAFADILEAEVIEDRDITFFMARFAHAWERMLVACADEQLAGFLLMTDGHIDMLFMDPGASRRGGGARLLAEAEARGAKSLECFRDNRGARRFYERHGWRITQEYERDFAGRRRSFVFYEKTGAF